MESNITAALLSWILHVSTIARLPGSSDAVSVAGVHATIISIFAAIAVSFLSIHLNAMHSIRQRILDRANVIGRQRVRIAFRHPVEDGYDDKDTAARHQHVSNVDAIAKKLPAWTYPFIGPDPNARPVDPTVPPPEETNQRARCLIQTLSLLRRTYPLHGVEHKSVSEVDPWLDESEYVLRRTLTSLEIGASHVASMIAEASADWQTGVQEDRAKLDGESTADSLLIDHALRVGDPAFQFDDVSRQLATLADEIDAIRAELGRYAGYRERLPSRRSLATVLAVTTLAFFSGVVLPLVDTGTSRWIYVGVPCAIYACGLATVLYAWRDYLRLDQNPRRRV